MTVRQSLRFSTVLGDWSDDGHGKTRQAEIEVFTDDESVELTEELILSNHNANAAKLGFGVGELWRGYENSSVSLDQAEAIQQKLGALYYGLEEEIELYPELSVNELPKGFSLGFGAFDIEDNGDGLFFEDQLGLALFIILSGIPGIRWREIKSKQLFGGFDSLLGSENRSVGYGLFY